MEWMDKYKVAQGRYKKFFCEFISWQKNTLAFIKVFLSNPRSTGAILPSSPQLTREMVSHAILEDDSCILELGAGTGAVTQALIQSGISPQRIIAIEKSSELTEHLIRRFTGVKVIQGNAEYLIDLLKNSNLKISTIISSLPLRSLPEKTVHAILEQIPLLLMPGGKYIQYTYSLKNNTNYYPKNCTLEYSKTIWFNIPPARVNVFNFILSV